jgi:hypothetical protein
MCLGTRLFSVLLGYNHRRKRPSHSQFIFRFVMSFPRDSFRAGELNLLKMVIKIAVQQLISV